LRSPAMSLPPLQRRGTGRAEEPRSRASIAEAYTIVTVSARTALKGVLPVLEVLDRSLRCYLNVWPAPTARGSFNLAVQSAPTYPVSGIASLAKMEIRTVRSS